MKIGICDDNESFCNALESSIREYLSECAIEANIYKYFCAKSLLEDEKACDILFLDMELGDASGIEVLEALKQRSAKTIVLVVTGYTQYIDNALDYNILRFMAKPIEPQRLQSALQKAIEVINDAYIVIYDLKTKAKYRLSFREIVYAETKMRKIYLHTRDNTYILKEGFKALKSQLNASFFAEPHYSYIVNMNFIKCFKRTEIILDVNGEDKIIRVSSDKQHDLRKKYTHYLEEDNTVISVF
ncbi:MAG: response regulator transcription factor [Clostridia bacterium]|nr:response regulator transcription factor [Clostridia bacterium]